MNLDQGFRFIKSIGLLWLFVFLLWFGCTFKSPQEPVWNVEFYIPLMSDKWTMEELTDDVEELSVDEANDQMILTFDEDLNLPIVERFLEVTIDRHDYPPPQHPMGTQTLDSLKVFTSGFLIQEAYPIARGVIKLSFNNPHPDDEIDVHIVLHDLYEPDGETNPEIDVTVPPRPDGEPFGWKGVNIDLQNYFFDPPVRNGENYFRYTVERLIIKAFL